MTPNHEKDNLLSNEVIRGKRRGFFTRKDADDFIQRREEDGYRTRVTDVSGTQRQRGITEYQVAWWIPGANYS